MTTKHVGFFLAAVALGAGACAADVSQDTGDGEPEDTSSSAAALTGVRRPVLMRHLDECLDGSAYLGVGSTGGVKCAPGLFGAAASFDGVDDRIEIPDAPAYHFTTAMSVSAWVKPSRVSGSGTIVNKWYAMDSFGLGLSDGQYTFSVAFPDGGWGQSYTVAAPATSGAWAHLAGVFDGHVMTIFVNGVAVASQSVQPAASPPRSLQQSTRPIAIGSHPSWSAYAGLIDEVSLYDQALTAAEVQKLSSTSPAERAAILVDHRLYALIAPNLDEYRWRAEQDRGFRVGLHVIQNLDDWSFAKTRSYLQSQRSTYTPSLEGTLFVGNVKLPSFYKNRSDLLHTRLLPRYFEDLDGVFTKTYADGATDPRCPTNAPYCAVNGPVTVPAHDFDYTEKGPSSYPELWAAFMPVGTAQGNAYTDFAAQLDPYLAKVIAYYKGQLPTNGKYYLVSNDRGEDFPGTWSSWPRPQIDFYGRPGPNGETGSACITPQGNVCYRRWPVESYATANDFLAYYSTQPWVGEGWQEGSIFKAHMNAALYEVAEVNVHSEATFSLIGAAEARQLSNAGLIMALDGCGVLGFRQPGGSNVDTTATVGDNIALSYLYGSSRAIAALGDPFWRVHYAHFPTIYHALKQEGSYLGAAHFARMKKLYDISGSSPWELRDQGMEMLVGDPFMDLSP
jgi:hypothetical protein